MGQDRIEFGVRQYPLPAWLQEDFTALYRFTIDCCEGDLIEDQMHPEWAAMRFTANGPPPAMQIGPGPLHPTWPIVASGPTSRAARVGLRKSEIWGIGLHPYGFAKYVPASASSLADRIVDGESDLAFAHFRPLLPIVRQRGFEPAAIAAQIVQFLSTDFEQNVAHSKHITACQKALREGEVDTVAELCDYIGVSQRSLERLCSRYFGFPPKLLLRRQRFLRSLAQFAAAEGASWIRSLDEHYYDQPHFVRDFKRFMGITPSEYAQMPHPILDGVIMRGMADQGVVPSVQLPTVLRYGPSLAD